jgi:hypothetical protein
VELSHNSPQVVRQEILDTNTIHLIAKSSGVSEEDLATMRVAEDPAFKGVWLYQVGGSQRAFKVLSEHLRNYMGGRAGGHTRAFLLAALTNRATPSAISDPGLRAIATNRPSVPVSWLRKEDSGTSTNKAGQLVSRSLSMTIVDGKAVTNETTHIPSVDEVCQWAMYTLVDGEIAWEYLVKFKADGTLDDIREAAFDAKELDPKYQKMIKAVETEVQAEMKRNASSGGFNPARNFWHLKKEKLKARGVEWRSPSELNPDTRYD